MKGLVKEKSEKKEMKEQEDKNQKEMKFKKVKEESRKIKKEVKAMTKDSKRKWIIPAIILIVFICIFFISTIFSLVNINNENIISGVSISGIDVSGLSKEEAIEKMTNIYNEKKEKDISVKYKDYENALNPTLMEVNYEIEKAVDEACITGKDGNIFINNYKIIATLIGKKNIDVNMTLNEDVTKQTIEDIGTNLPGILIQSSHVVEGDELIITKGKSGVVINTQDLLDKVRINLKNINDKSNYIEIPVEQKEPDPINIDAIHEEIYTEAKDAYYTKEPFTVYPEVEGIDFDVEQAKQLLQEDKEEYVIKLKITKPKVTLDQIGSEAFPDQLATFTTRYDPSDVNRTTNLQIACQKINGKVILAGDTFSYNKILGPRTAQAGYKNGKIYEAGQVVDGIGGGICQISSTLYNAILMANLEVIERRNHQFVTSYLPAGRDATVVYGAIDFKFKNTRKYPVRIVASAKNGIATVSIYGIKEENEYTFSFYTKTIDVIPFTTKYEEDPSLSGEEEKIKQKGTNGIKTETYITKMLNGKVISTTLLSRDTYSAMERIVIKGKGASVVPEATPTVPQIEENTMQTNPNQTTTPTDANDAQTTDSETENDNTNNTTVIAD